jgi:putative endonuclease
MTIDRREAGRRGESAAAALLSARGLRLLAMNHLCRSGEVDLVMEDGDVLVFVEVKKRTTTTFGDGEEAVTPGKCRRIVRAAMNFIQYRRLGDRLVRFDVVVLEPGGAARHYPAAFVPDPTLTYY